MKDRVIQGLIAGIVAWLPQMIFTQAAYLVFHVTKLRFLDFAGILAFAHRPRGLVQSLFAEFIVVAQMVGMGVLFVYIIRIIKSSNLLLKSAIYGGASWFIIYNFANLYKTEGIYQAVDFNTAVCNFFGSIIWGIALGWALLYLNQRYGTEDPL